MFRIKIRTFLTKLKGISVFLKCIFQLLENPKKSKKIRIRAKSGRRFALFFYHHRLVSLHVFAEQFLQRRSPSIRKHYDSKKPFPIMVLDAVKSGWYMIFKASSTMRRLCSPRILMTAPVPQKSCSKALRRSKTALLFCHMLIIAGWS